MFRLAILAIAFATPIFAQDGLNGLQFALRVATYAEDKTTLFESATYRGVVGEGLEFGLDREGGTGDLDIVPVEVDISAKRITLNYRTADPAELFEAAFNGYVLGFTAPCDLFASSKVDRTHTNMPLMDDQVFWEGNLLFINVSGFRYNRKSRIAIDFEINECSGQSTGKKSSS